MSVMKVRYIVNLVMLFLKGNLPLPQVYSGHSSHVRLIICLISLLEAIVSEASNVDADILNIYGAVGGKKIDRAN
jgi:hypothetical protein